MDLMPWTDLEFPMEQPEMLVMMRAVQEFPMEPEFCPRDEVCLRGLRNMWANQYLKFKEDLDKRETEWLQYKLARHAPKVQAIARSEWDGKGECPTCKRGPEEVVSDGECLAKVKKWL